MTSPTIRYRHVSSMALFKDNSNGYEIGWRWPRGDNPHLFVVYMEAGVYTMKNTFNGSKIYLDKGHNQPYYIVIDSASWQSGDVIFVWNNQEVFRKHAQFPDAKAINNSERQCDGVCETKSSGDRCYNLSVCACNLLKTNCGWETNYSHFWGLTKRTHAFTWGNWANLKVLADDDWEFNVIKVSNTENYMDR